MTYKLNPFTGKLDTSDGPQGPAGVVSAAGPGSQGTPSISFAADLDTGLYNYTPNGIAVSTGGTGRLFVDSSGNLLVKGTERIYLNSFNNATDHAGYFGRNTSTGALEMASQTLGGGYPMTFHTGNTERLRITSSGELQFKGAGTNGSPGSPAVRFNGSAPANSLVIDSSGRLGLGTSSPSQLLEVENSSGSVAIGITSSDTGYAELYFGDQSNASASALSYEHSSDKLRLYNGGFPRLTIDSSGNVGIGTQTPDNKLHIFAGDSSGSSNSDALLTLENSSASSLQFLAGTTSYSDILFGDSGINSAGRIRYDHAGNFISFGTSNGSEKARIASEGTFRVKGAGTAGVTDAVQLNGAAPSNSLVIDSSGRLGVGTGSPGTSLEIVSSTDDDHLTLYKTGVTGGAGPGIKFSNQNNVGTRVHLAGIRNELTSGTPGAEGGALVFTTKNNGDASPQERLYISAAGNVGIGTASPERPLHVVGDIVRFDNPSGAPALLLLDRTSGSEEGFRFVVDLDGTGSLSIEDMGTAVSGAGTERLRIDSDGRLLVGTNTWSGNDIFAVKGQANLPTGSAQIAFGRGNFNAGAGSPITSINFVDFSTDENKYGSITCWTDGLGVSGTNTPGRIEFATTAAGASSPTERMRISNGGDLIFNGGQTAGQVNKLSIVGASATGGYFIHNTSATSKIHAYYQYNGTAIGNISTTTTNTAYNTSSDYRLKENVVAVTDGITRLQQLKPSRFNFIADPDRTVDGFLAHEAQAVVPECVTGTKDEVDEDGNPVYQGIDQSKLVPLLTAALQEALAKIETLEQRLTDAGIA